MVLVSFGYSHGSPLDLAVDAVAERLADMPECFKSLRAPISREITPGMRP